MNFIFLHGPPACGKLTVARALSERTGIPVFHNHLVVDALSAVFAFGSEPFVRLREEMWLAVFAAAATEDRSLIFTFAPERTVRPSFVPNAVEAVESKGGRVRFVALSCSAEILAERVEDNARAAHGKLRSAALLRELTAAGAFDVAPPPQDLMLDTGVLSPEDAADRITSHFSLKSG